MAGSGSIELFLIRHAKAAEASLYEADEERPLTADGRVQAQEVGKALAKQGVAFDVIIASPLVRAVQTAELVLASIGWGGALEASARLAPGASTRQTAAWLAERAAGASGALVAVGHEPSISALAELLGSGERVSAFHKAEAALVEEGVLRWRLTAP